MLRKITAVLLLGVLISSFALTPAFADTLADNIVIKIGEQSDNVILLQMRLQDLGYYDYKITGFFGDFTKDALQDFQKNNGLSADGVAGSKTLDLMYGNDAKRAKLIDVSTPAKTATKPKVKKFGKLVDWGIVNTMWKIGMTCKVIDLDTGKSYNMKRVNKSYGVPHADVAPATKTDNKTFLKTFGGSYSWYRRAVIVYISGQAIAASTNGMPHGSTGIPGDGMIDPSDGSIGQVCIHFLNSRGNAHDIIDPAHQYQVRRAAGLKYSGARSSLVYPGD